MFRKNFYLTGHACLCYHVFAKDYKLYNPDEARTADIMHVIKNIGKALTQQNCV